MLWIVRPRAAHGAICLQSLFVLRPWQCQGSPGVREWIEGMEFGALLADKACDANWLIQAIGKRAEKAVIAQMPTRRKPLAMDQHM